MELLGTLNQMVNYRRRYLSILPRRGCNVRIPPHEATAKLAQSLGRNAQEALGSSSASPGE